MSKSIGYSISNQEFKEMVDNSKSYRELAIKIGYKECSSSLPLLKRRVSELELNTEHFLGQGINKGRKLNGGSRLKYNDYLSQVFIENSNVKRKIVRNYILKYNLLEYKCELCNCDGSWLDTKISLELDHKNGVNNDNRLSNLRFLCPNCHATTTTYRGRNVNDGIRVHHISKPQTGRHISKHNQCVDCGAKISNRAERCIPCAAKHKTTIKIDRPTRNELKEMIRIMPFTEIGDKYSADCNTIRFWCKKYNLPYRKLDINNYTDKAWMTI